MVFNKWLFFILNCLHILGNPGLGSVNRVIVSFWVRGKSLSNLVRASCGTAVLLVPKGAVF